MTNLVTQTKPLMLVPPLPFHMTAKSSFNDLQSRDLIGGGSKKLTFLGMDLGSLAGASSAHVDSAREGIELAGGASGESDDNLSHKFHPFSCKDTSPIPFLSMGRLAIRFRMYLSTFFCLYRLLKEVVISNTLHYSMLSSLWH